MYRATGRLNVAGTCSRVRILIHECYVIREEILHISKEDEEREAEEKEEMNKENILHKNKNEES